MLRLLQCNATYGNENWKREVYQLTMYHHLGKYYEFQARMNSRVATQSVLKFIESLRVSRKMGLKKLGKKCKQEVSTFFSFRGGTK